jgi:hypothetical protein
VALCRALEGEAPIPYEHYIGWLSEEFGRLPTEIEAERDRLPVGTLEQIIEYRRMAEAYFARKAATTHAQTARLRLTPMGAMAEVIWFELLQEGQSRG